MKINLLGGKFRSGSLLPVLVCLVMSFLLPACGNKDKAISEAIEAKKKEMKELAGLTTTVDKGTVTISGECPDSSGRSMCEQAIAAIPGVKQVVNNMTVAPPPAAPAPAPVTISADDELTKSVADIVKDYPDVRAAVKDGEVTLTGEIKRSSLTRLMQALHTMKPKKINNQLTIK